MKYRELLGPVVGDKTQAYEFLPGASGMAHLDARAGLYEMYKIMGVKFLYRSSVGTTTNGEVLMGIDFDSRDIVLSYSGTAALQPKSIGPVWRDHTLVVPPARAMKQKWLLTSNLQDDAPARGAFTLQVTNTSSSTTGSIWVEYNLEFASPRIPTRPTAINVINVNDSGQTNINNMTRTSATVSPTVPGAGPFYVMTHTNYDFNLQTGFTKTKMENTGPLNNIWSNNDMWQIVGPSAIKWFKEATSPTNNRVYGLAMALTLTALKQLAGIR